ncbi:MAG: hypothetical protein U0939_24775 [Pirellulales bacterium]
MLAWLCLARLSTVRAVETTQVDESASQPPVTALVLHPRGDLLIAGSQSGLQFYTWPELRPQQRQTTSVLQMHDLAIDAGGQRLLVAGGEPAQSGRIELLDLQQREPNRTVRLGDDVVYRVRWAAQDRLIVAAGGDGMCRVVNAADFTERLAYRGHSRAVLALTLLSAAAGDIQGDDSTRLQCLTGGVDMTLRLWNSHTGITARTLENHVAPINDAALRPQSKSTVLDWVASISEDRTVRLWQPAIGRLVRFARLPSPPRALAWSHDGERLYVACNDGEVRELSFESLEVLRRFPGRVGRPHALLVDSQRAQLAVAGQHGVNAIMLPANPKP